MKCHCGGVIIDSYKRSVVEEDERDKGLRNELNWGHTVGHAIEGMGKRSFNAELQVYSPCLPLDVDEKRGFISWKND